MLGIGGGPGEAVLGGQQGGNADAVIAGAGPLGYRMAVDYLAQKLAP